ncbi:MAG: 8-amino-7-oxononanoate synthase [Acidimicrobiales bacterium]|jgi:8-amino-7-oxononanoate synthase|nr:8-amino-7-oxononanoate synthase [Acidimicrobiales bacterium]
MAAVEVNDPPDSWTRWLDRQTRAIHAAGQWRTLRPFDALGPAGTLSDDPNADGLRGQVRHLVSFASNDYLGLSSHSQVIEASREAALRWGTGAGASRLICGSRPAHHALEADLAAWKNTEAALVFSSGFAANLGVLSALGGQRVRVVSDELNHASIIDGARLARAEVAIYPHLDIGAAHELLAEWPGRSVLVTDAVFSMDGDAADLGALTALCARHDAVLVVDEAHSVWGPELTGAGPDGPLVVRVGTLSKTLGSQGGFVAGSQRVVDLLVNTARPFIFSTALSPSDAAAARAALAVLRSAEGDGLVRRLRAHTNRLAPDHPSPIVPLVVGDEADAVAASGALALAGYWVPAIRPPTVAPGTSRLRITCSAAHTDAQVDGLLVALDALGLR